MSFYYNGFYFKGWGDYGFLKFELFFFEAFIAYYVADQAKYFLFKHHNCAAYTNIKLHIV
jgi:hypothetical protein